MEIVEALPDKADKRKNVLISNSPEFFSSGGETRKACGTPSTRPAYAPLSVGTFVGMSGQSSPEVTV
ncbi:hypothetical protein [Burkholderia pseudomallei]|uniref:hypothetical protein n=1 Tax=Burkholderia pseudomallei TaxID=28450 RepID=UPI0011779AC8|nr:hypothetical protein [Burkholderia pseudomallei]MCV9913321.1 hypothetical protein [Burkholderia pseudomallei]MCV9970703.1 hypothetical protein [Burkholderia pseudomallei]MCW0068173.1 hypothetical protein [Burkholderia pseudomallei]